MKNLTEKFLYWKLAIAKCALSAFIAGAVAFATSTSTIKWDSLSGFERFMIILGSIIIMAKDVLSFLSTAIEDIKKRSGEDTKFFYQSEHKDTPTP